MNAIKTMSARTMNELLDEMRERTAADAAIFMTFREHVGEAVVSSIERSGNARNWQLIRNGTPPSGFDHDQSDEAIGMREGQWCLRAPARRHFNAFCWLEEDIGQLAPWERTDAFQNLYQANSYEQQYRAILVDQGVVVGWCALMWTNLRLPDRVERVAGEHLDELKVRAIDLASVRRMSHRILLDSKGKLVGVDKEALEHFERPQLFEMARRARRRSGSSNGDAEGWCHDGYRVSCVPMSGEAGRATLVLMDPLDTLTIDMRCALTKLQRRIAELVADGNSNDDVAESMGVSRNTIKYHLKNIYSIVGVSNRVELASFMKS